MKIFHSLLLDTDINKLLRVIRNVLTQHHTSLDISSRNNLHLLANEMYAAGLISLAVLQSPSFDSIIAEFMVALVFMHSLSEIEQCCAKFLSILTKIGGPCALASQALQEDWIKDGKAECGVELQLGM